jgi:uncharacterized damage-inducible protein DinB
MTETKQPEPWLRGTLTETPAVLRAVLHAFQTAEEDLIRYCGALTDDDIHQRPAGAASIAFHLRHIPGSIDRLLTYAEGGELSEEQLRAMQSEGDAEAPLQECLEKLSAGFKTAAERVRRIDPIDFDQPRYVGRKRMPTTVGGLLVHVADHTQRHVGQAITTARIVAPKQ